MDLNSILNKIRLKGGRITKIRKEIIRILAEADCLMSQADILARLNKLKLQPNRSTIFRELLFLAKNNIVLKNTISGVLSYEMPHDHHHHLVCLTCSSIAKIKIGNHLEEQEKQIAKKNKFNITNHCLEFYGYCRNCQA